MLTHSLSRKIMGVWLALSVGLGGCSTLNTAFQVPTPAPFLTATVPAKPTVSVQRGDIIRSMTYSASAVSKVQTTLQFRGAGQVEKILVQPGDLVKKGDLVAQLVANVSDFDLQRAQIALDKANLLYQQAVQVTPKTQKDYDAVIGLKKIDVEQAQIALDELKSKLEASKLIASSAGEVTRVNINVGDTVAAYKPVIVLEDPTQMEVMAALPASDFNKLAEGLPVMISRASDPANLYPGKISQLGYVANNYSVRMAFDGTPPPGLKLGGAAKVQFDVEKRMGVLWLPPQVLQGSGSAQYVMVWDNNKQVKVNIQVGIATDAMVEITQGLTEGQKVVVP